MQEANFDYEILVGEDDSSDGTREIVKSYAEKYPDKIRLFLNDRKNVIYINGKATGRWNLVNNLKHCRGEYIALLEGDDYWTSPHKLQKQVDYLELHKDYSFCYHRVERIRETGDLIRSDYGLHLKKDTYTVEDLYGRNFIPTCSVVFRSGIQNELPDWFYKILTADWALHILNARRGKFGYLDEIMAVYRTHSEGVWSKLSFVERFETDIQTYQILGSNLGLLNEPGVKMGLAERYLWLAMEYQQQRKKSLAASAAFKSYRLFPFDKDRRAIKILIDLYLLPFLLKLRKIKIRRRKK